jgi:8-oxo-dGTP pyrophosphatase MutT (NUDIX family)
LHLNEDEISNFLRSAYISDQRLATDGYAETSLLQAGQDLKCAAVLLPLFQWQGDWHLVFTRRTDTVESHKGQVSFPGGACDEMETMAEQTALREAQEEIGLDPGDVHLLGRMNDIVTITHFRVTPVVGVIPWPYRFQLSQQEVKRVFSIPLRWMAEPVNWDEFHYTPDGSHRTYPVITYHSYDGETLWGASARITQNFLEILGLIRKSD